MDAFRRALDRAFARDLLVRLRERRDDPPEKRPRIERRGRRMARLIGAAASLLAIQAPKLWLSVITPCTASSTRLPRKCEPVGPFVPAGPELAQSGGPLARGMEARWLPKASETC